MRTRLSVVLLFALVVLPYRSEARLPRTSQQPKAPANLSIADWSAIRAEYDRHRRGFFPVVGEHDGEHHARSYSQQWLAKFDGQGFEVKPNDGSWTWGLELASYGFAGAERSMEGRASIFADVDHAHYQWNSEIEEWFVNEPQGLEHGFTVAQRPTHPAGPLTLHLNVRGGLTAHADGRSASFVDRDGTARITYSQLQATDARGRVLPTRMLAEPNGLRIEVEEATATYPIRIDPFVQQAYLKASNTDAFDHVGYSVAISGDTVLVGAYGEASNATGVNGDQSNNSATDSGAAYVFVRSNGTWSQQAYLKASNANAQDAFGWAVAISGDTAIVGATGEASNATGVNGDQSNNSVIGSGAAYMFVRNGTTWSQQAYVKASSPQAFVNFGSSVAISGDTAIVGGPGASIFFRSGASWSQQAYFPASNTAFGYSVAISGDTAIVGAPEDASNATGVNGDQSNNLAPGSGAAYVFVRNGTTWSQQAYLKASNTYAGDAFGISMAISGDTAIVGAINSRAAYIFVRSDTAWSQQAYLTASDEFDLFAGSVAISGDTAIVRATRGADVFQRNGTAWSQQAHLTASSTDPDEFGYSVEISGNTAIVGAPTESSNATGVNGEESDNSAQSAGAAYVFTTSDSSITPPPFITAPSPSTPLRNEFSGFEGAHLAVGANPLRVTSLGRFCVAGNSQSHTVKLVSANTKADLPGSAVSVTMAGCTPGQFVSASLPTALTLAPLGHYYLVSQEQGGGDKWLDLGPVTSGPGASIVGSVYFNGVNWITSGAPGTSYVPPSIQFDVLPAPSSTAFVLSYNLDNRPLRNDYEGFVGMRLQIGGANLSVTSVGRACIAGNSQMHTVKFVNASTGADIPGASAVVDLAGCAADFVYKDLASPVTLLANTAYYLVSQETVGGDKWFDQSELTTQPGAAVLSSVYSLGTGYATNEAYHSYGPPNFLYTK